MIRLSLTRADASVTETETLTAGRVGLECAFTFNADWDGLEKVAVFEGAETIEVALGTANVAVVPPECMATAGYNLRCGAYGMSATQAIVIPTVWAKAGKIKDSASPDEETLSDFTPTLAAQVIAKANTAEEIAASLNEQAIRGEFDGFSPYVAVEEITNGHRVSITDSVGTNEFDVMDGASAYEQAVSGGYTGTEQQFNTDLAGFKTYAAQTASDATAAAASATAAETAQTAAEIAQDAAEDAQEAAEDAQAAAAQSATDAATSASTASTKASEAAQSASSAAGSANTATTKANEASSSATNAASSASAAATSATNAGVSATAAAGSASSAETAKTAAETAQEAAEAAAASVSESAAQIAQNTEDVADLKSASSDFQDYINPYYNALKQFDSDYFFKSGVFSVGGGTASIDAVDPLTVTSASSGVVRTPLIVLDTNETNICADVVELSGASMSGSIAFFNSGGSYISQTDFSMSNGKVFKTTPIPAGAAKYRLFFNFYSATTYTFDSINVYYGTTQIIEKTFFDVLNSNIGLLGNKWTAFGDSLTAASTLGTGVANYTNYVAESLGLTLVNLGVGGTGYMNDNSVSKAFYQRYSDIPADTDVLTVFGSLNDLNLAYNNIGTLNDTGTETLYGCMNTFLSGVYAVNTGMRIGIILPTPWQWMNRRYPGEATTLKTEQYINALIAWANWNSIPILNLFDESGLRPWDSDFRTAYYKNADGTHPNSLGHYRFIYPKVKAFVQKLIAK